MGFLHSKPGLNGDPLLPPSGARARFESNALVLHGPDPAQRSFSVEVVGESFHQDALWDAVGSRAPLEGRRHHARALLVREPANEHDSNAIAVYVALNAHFEPVGHLPRDVAPDYGPDFEVLEVRGYRAGACDAVIVGGGPDGDRGTTYLGIWLHLDHPGAIVPAEEEDPRTWSDWQRTREERHEARPLTGASRHSASSAGIVRGRHYTDWVDDVKSLKRHAALDECHALLLELIEAVERESAEQRMSPAPWYYEQLAIVLRKQRDFAAEVDVLERYLAHPHPTSAPRTELRERLEKARAKRDH